MKKPALKPHTKANIKKRKHWRERAAKAAMVVATWPVGAPAKERGKAMKELAKCVMKIGQWYRGGRERLVIHAIQRMAISAWRGEVKYAEGWK